MVAGNDLQVRPRKTLMKTLKMFFGCSVDDNEEVQMAIMLVHKNMGGD